MSGHMVSVEHDGAKHIYMANIADPEQARDEVIRRSGVKCHAEALAPINDATFEHFGVSRSEVRHFCVTDSTGKLISDK
jgi:hypothetical protein